MATTVGFRSQKLKGMKHMIMLIFLFIQKNSNEYNKVRFAVVFSSNVFYVC